MPIERKSRYEFDDPLEEESIDEVEAVTPEGDMVAKVEEDEIEMPKKDESADGETATLSLSLLGGQSVKPGDVIRLEVVESSEDDGTVTVKYRRPGASETVMEFDKPLKGAI